MLRDQREPEAWSQGSKQWSNKFFKCQGLVEHGINASHKMLAEFTNNYEPDAKNTEEAIFKLHEKIEHLQAQTMTCKTKTVSMNIDSKQ